MSLYLVRHARTAWNDKGLALGQVDVDLDEVGLAQVQKVSARFKGVPTDLILSSDLIRCQKTAQGISEASGAPIEIETALRERSFGDWETEDYKKVIGQMIEIAQRDQILWQDVRPPNGESHRDVWTRLEPLVKRVFEDTRNLILVTHGGTASVLLAMLLNARLETTRSFQFSNAAVTQFDRRPEGTFLLISYNDTRHLEAPHTDTLK